MLKEAHQSLGVVNAGEIPEGKVVDLKPGATKITLQGWADGKPEP